MFPATVVAVFLFVAVVSLWPLSAAWRVNLGSVLQARGDLLESLSDGERAALRQQAVGRYREALQIAPYNRTAQQRWGVILMDTGDFSGAVEHLHMAWRVDPSNTTTHKALGLAYIWVGDLEKALPLLRDVRNIVEELNYWGWWRGTQQETEQAISAYRMSLMLKPDQQGVRQQLDQLEKVNSRTSP